MRRPVPVWLVGAVSALLAIVAVVAVVVVRGGQGPATATSPEPSVAAVGPRSDETRVTKVAEAPPPLVRASVSDHGATLRNRDGVVVEIPAGALPEGATIEISPAPTPKLPEGVAPVGRFYKITTSAELTGLATLRLPIPAGAETSQLATYQIRADGVAVEYVGEVVGGAYVVSLPAFTDEGLGSGEGLHTTIVAQTLEVGRRFEGQVLIRSGEEPFRVEYEFLGRELSPGSVDIGAGRNFAIFRSAEIIEEPGLYAVAIEVTHLPSGRRAAGTLAGRVPPLPLTIQRLNIPRSGFRDGMAFTTFEVCVQGGEPGYVATVEVTGAPAQTGQFGVGERGYLHGGCGSVGPVQLAPGGEFIYRIEIEDVVNNRVADSGRGRTGVPLSVTLSTDPERIKVGDEVRLIATAFGGASSDSAFTEGDLEYSWSVQGRGFPLSYENDLVVTFSRTGEVPVEVTVFEQGRFAGRASAALVVRVVEGLSVELASPAGTTVKAGTQLQLVAEVSGAAADAQLRYVWGLPDGDVETDVPTVDVTLAKPGIVAFAVTVFDDRHGEEADAIVELLVQEVPPLVLAITDVPDVVPQGEVVTIGISITGGLVEGAEGEILPYELTVDYGDGSTEEFALTEPEVLIEHTYAESGTYTVTVVATSPDGQTLTEAVELGVRGAFTVAMVRPLREEFVVLANEVVIEVEGRTARVVAFGYQTEWSGYEGFTIDSAGNTQTFSVDCVNHTTVEHQGDDLVYDPVAGTISGTINLLWTRLDVGNECPFGGIDDVQTRTADVDITIVDGQGRGRFLSEEALPSFSYVLAPKTN